MYYGYARVSTERQNDTSIEVQIEFLAQQANKLGIPFSPRFEKQSGKNVDGRAVFFSLLQNLVEGDVVGIYDNSRLGRNTEENLKVLKTITDKKAQLQCDGKFVDPKNPQDIMIFSVQSAFSTYQRDIQLLKSRNGIDAKKKNGDWVLRGDLFGWKTYKTKGKTVAEIDEPAAKIVRYIFDRYIIGDSIFKISRDLENEVVVGHENFKFNPCNIRRLLLKPIYMGYYTLETSDWSKISKMSRKELQDSLVKSNVYSPIITEEQYWQVFENWRTVNKTHAKQFQYRYSFYEVSSILRCSSCGVGYAHSYYKSRVTDYFNEYYVSLSHKKECSSAIKSRPFRKDIIEEMLRLTLFITFSSGDEVGRFFAEQRSKINTSLEDLDSQISSIDSLIKDNDTKIARVVDAISEGILDKTLAQDKLIELKKVKVQLNDQKNTLRSQVLLQQRDLEDILLEQSEDVVEKFIHAGSTIRRNTYKKLIKDALVYDGYFEITYHNSKMFKFYQYPRKKKNVDYMNFEVWFNDEMQYSGTLLIPEFNVKINHIEEIDEFRKYVNDQMDLLAEKVNKLLRDCEIYTNDEISVQS